MFIRALNVGRKMKKQKFFKITGCLLLFLVLLFPAIAATVVINDDQVTILVEPENNIVNSMTSATREILYDNGLPDGADMLSCASWDTFNREIVDDFIATDTWNVTGGECRITTQSGASSIPSMKMIFYQDLGNIPSTTIYASRTANITCTLTGDTYFGRPEILVTCTIDTVTLSPGKWWVCFQPQATEPCYWLTATMNLHYVYVSWPDAGIPKWTDGNVIWPGMNYDVAWLLTGTDSGEDVTPPVTTCVLEGVMEGGFYISDVSVTLNATDDKSGVDYTMYKIDSGEWAFYTEPFMVTANGEHTVFFYSVDNAGNIETEKSVSFTIIKPAPPISIMIQGGLGVSAMIKNTGTADLSNIEWTITVNGSMIFFGQTKSGTIPFLAAGASEKVKDFIIGFGKTGITVEAGGESANASGFVVLFLLIGVS